ncbi:MAG: SDR family oxidoreductase [Anaerolineales bacterium]|jgi:short-subunit dehydrogenase
MANNFFSGKAVVITGASIGIGRELAFQMAAQGARLALAARNQEQLEAVAAGCRDHGGTAVAIPTDVADWGQAENLIQKTVEEFGRIDILINNAGISMWSLFDQVEELKVFEQIMQTNYMGSVYCTHFALPYLKSSKGQLVAISSLAGKTGVPARSGYAASKHALVGFFDTLRIELAKDGVDVTLVYPGFVLTETRLRALTGDGSELGYEPVQEKGAMTAEECAAQILPAIAKRKRELVMTPRGKIGQWLKLIAPALVDRIAKNAIEKGR